MNKRKHEPNENDNNVVEEKVEKKITISDLIVHENGLSRRGLYGKFLSWEKLKQKIKRNASFKQGDHIVEKSRPNGREVKISLLGIPRTLTFCIYIWKNKKLPPPYAYKRRWQYHTCEIEGCKSHILPPRDVNSFNELNEDEKQYLKAHIASNTRAATAEEMANNTNSEFENCQKWLGATGEDDRPVLSFGKLHGSVYKFTYELYHDVEVNEQMMCHLCRTKMCVNPTHSRPGDYPMNGADMARDGVHQGSNSGVAKLDEDKARAIFDSYYMLHDTNDDSKRESVASLPQNTMYTNRPFKSFCAVKHGKMHWVLNDYLKLNSNTNEHLNNWILTRS